MPRPALTGSRIRERRIDLGMRQARLAEACGISASYLNLIEHNRRRIGGKLLNAIADALGVEASGLSEGADTALLDALSDAAAGGLDAQPETDRAEELAGRFPGWARLVTRQAARVAALEGTVEALNDRLGHDPHLAAALHDILSAATAIRSASAILAEEDDVDPEWQARFHRNINEDSRRLAEAAQGLVSYLDAGPDTDRGALAPQEEVEAWLAARGHHIAELERALAADPEVIVRGADALTSVASRDLALAHLRGYRADAAKLPLGPLRAALDETGPDPAGPDPAWIARRFGADLATVFRRLAALPSGVLPSEAGLAVCDASGTLVFRKPIDGFSLPRFGAACPLLPLYQALGRPMSPVRVHVEQAGRTPRRFLTFSVAQPSRPAGFDQPTVFEATMLILPEEAGGRDRAPAIPIGPTCRICPREACAARREPSILTVAG